MSSWTHDQWTRDVGLMLIGWVVGVVLATAALYVLGWLFF